MANIVVKSDGSKVPFDGEKMKGSIMMACEDAGLSEDQRDTIVEKISALVLTSLEGKEEVSSAEIKNAVLTELDVANPEVAKAWRDYDEHKGQ